MSDKGTVVTFPQRNLHPPGAVLEALSRPQTTAVGFEIVVLQVF
jgi:hypothetical protein